MRRIRLDPECQLHFHLDPAARIARVAQDAADAQVSLCRGRECANGCSVIEMLLLAARNGEPLELEVAGPGAARVAAVLEEMFNEGAGI